MSTFAERFSKALDERNMTAAELSRRLGVNEGTISNYKKGSYEPKQRRLESIAKILDVSIAWLMGADVPMHDIKTTTENENTHYLSGQHVSDDEAELLTIYRKLNTAGKQKALEYISDLTDMTKYTEKLYKIAARNGKFEEKPLSDSEIEELLNCPDVDDL
ncbi:MAG: helix-turn-helix domain-containing protein [Acutalibacteraceae bacterium]